MSGTNCPGDSHAWEHWEQRVWTIHLINDCEYLCFSDMDSQCVKMRRASEGRNERDKASLARVPTSPLSQPSSSLLQGPRGLPLHREEPRRGRNVLCPRSPWTPVQGPECCPQRGLWLPLSLSWSCYLNSIGF